MMTVASATPDFREIFKERYQMIVQAVDICKRFDATVALDHAKIELVPGQIHSIVGENGAGKSTLLKVIAAVHKPDSGKITIDGQHFAPLNFLDASKKGVTIVFQESSINPYLTIAENIFIGRHHEFSRPFLGLDWKRMNREAQDILASIESGIDIRQNIRSLDFGQWKLIEIARALSYNPKVLLFDESTAFLNNRESRVFLQAVRNLRNRQIAIGFVSHHMNEIFEVSDRITVMRDGKFIAEYGRNEATVERIESAMVGRSIGSSIYPDHPTVKASDDVILSVKNLSVDNRVTDITFDLRRGEILGVGGLKGAGGEAILNAIYGSEKITAGQIYLSSSRYLAPTPSKSVLNRIALVPGERTVEGLIPEFSIHDNLNMTALPRRGLLRDKAKEKALTGAQIDSIGIKTVDAMHPVNSLSGGNMQKVVLGKCLSIHPDILLLNNPTRGIDIKARQDIYALLRELCSQGVSILLLTEDLLELLGMSDRILLLKKKRVSKIFEENRDLAEEDVIRFIV